MKTQEAAIFMMNTGGDFDAKRLHDLTGINYQLATDVISNIKRSKCYEIKINQAHPTMCLTVVNVLDTCGNPYPKSAPPKPKMTYNKAILLMGQVNRVML
jgi:hypothetical protein